jgi:hypothetical protein
MSKHKTEDYKNSAVKYYLTNEKRDGYKRTYIYRIAYNAINNKERPGYLSRSKNSSTGLDEPVKPKFTRLEIGKP